MNARPIRTGILAIKLDKSTQVVSVSLMSISPLLIAVIFLASLVLTMVGLGGGIGFNEAQNNKQR